MTCTLLATTSLNLFRFSLSSKSPFVKWNGTTVWSINGTINHHSHQYLGLSLQNVDHSLYTQTEPKYYCRFMWVLHIYTIGLDVKPDYASSLIISWKITKFLFCFYILMSEKCIFNLIFCYLVISSLLSLDIGQSSHIINSWQN